MAATSIKQLIQQMVQPYVPKMVIGAVTSVDPLQVTLQNDINISLSAISLTVPDRLEPLNVGDRKSTRLNSSHREKSRMPSSA